MPSLLRLTPDGRVDLLKIDIEGAEVELFRDGSTAWLAQVRNIVIELHGGECELAFFRALAPYRYELSRSGELTFCRNIRQTNEVGRADGCYTIQTAESPQIQRDLPPSNHLGPTP